MTTLKEQQARLAEAQHELAVWQVLYKYLDDTYVAKEGGLPDKAIKVPDCLKPIVEEDTIERILAFLSQSQIAKMEAEIAKIENMEVVVIEKGDSDGNQVIN